MKGQVRNGERKPASEWHSPTAAHGRRNKSVHQREASELGSLTSYRARKISRDSKRKPESEGHSRPVERTRRDKSGQLTRTSTRDTHSLSSADGGQVRTTEESWRARATYQLSSVGGGVIKGREESERARGTHVLSITDGRTSQDQRLQASKGGTLTFCRTQRGGQIRAVK